MHCVGREWREAWSRNGIGSIRNKYKLIFGLIWGFPFAVFYHQSYFYKPKGSRVIPIRVDLDIPREGINLLGAKKLPHPYHPLELGFKQ